MTVAGSDSLGRLWWHRPVQGAWIVVAVVALVLWTVGFVDGWSRPVLIGGAPAVDLVDEFGISVHLTLVIGLAGPAALSAALAGLVVWRRPEDPMALLFGLTLVTFGTAFTKGLGVAFVTRPALQPAIVVITAVAMGACGAFIATFPDGRAVPRWALAAPVLLVAGVTVHPSFVETVLTLPELPAAAGRFRAMGLLVGAGFAVGVAGQLWRYRDATPRQRQQIKWVVFPLGLTTSWGLVILAISVVDAISPRVFAIVLLSAVPVFLFLPAAWARAILRHRLYEIDRLVTRTVSYAVVVVVLGAVYTAGVVGLGAVVSSLSGQDNSELVVAASVLAVAALFRPLRTRVQRAVDRRFNRTTYGGRLAVDGFRNRLRDEVDRDAIVDELATTAAITLQPAHVSVALVMSDKGRDGDGNRG